MELESVKALYSLHQIRCQLSDSICRMQAHEPEMARQAGMHQQVDTVPSILTTLVLAAIGSDGDVQMMTMERRDDDGSRWRVMQEG